MRYGKHLYRSVGTATIVTKIIKIKPKVMLRAIPIAVAIGKGSAADPFAGAAQSDLS